MRLFVFLTTVAAIAVTHHSATSTLVTDDRKPPAELVGNRGKDAIRDTMSEDGAREAEKPAAKAANAEVTKEYYHAKEPLLDPATMSSLLSMARAPDNNWHDNENYHIDSDLNFCKHIARTCDHNGIIEHCMTEVQTCAGLPQDPPHVGCDSSYKTDVNTTTGLITQCKYDNGACTDGQAHECPWSLYMHDLMTQTAAQDTSCMADLLEAKRSLDGLLHSVNHTYSLLMVENEIIKAGNVTIRGAIADQVIYWDRYMAAQKDCDGGGGGNGTDSQQLYNELQELLDIAQPNRSAVNFIRDQGYQDPEDTPVEYYAPSSLLEVQDGSLVEVTTDLSSDMKACEMYTSLVERTSKHHAVADPNCHQARIDVQTEWLRVYTGLYIAYNNSKDVFHANWAECLSEATYNYKIRIEGVGGVDDKIQDAAQDIHGAQINIAELEPRLHDLEHAVSLMNKYVDDLTIKCNTEVDLEGRLGQLYTLILAINQCPGRNDFTLTVPDRTTVSRGTTPMPTPWEERFPDEVGV